LGSLIAGVSGVPFQILHAANGKDMGKHQKILDPDLAYLMDVQAAVRLHLHGLILHARHTAGVVIRIVPNAIQTRAACNSDILAASARG